MEDFDFKKFLTENQMTTNSKLVNEYYGGAPGKCIVTISGEGLVKDGVIKHIRKLLENMGGDITLKVE